ALGGLVEGAAGAVGLDVGGEGLADLGDLLRGEDAAQVHGAGGFVGGGDAGRVRGGVEDRELARGVGRGGSRSVGGGVESCHSVIVVTVTACGPGEEGVRTWTILLRRQHPPPRSLTPRRRTQHRPLRHPPGQRRCARWRCRRHPRTGCCWASSTSPPTTASSAPAALPTTCSCTPSRAPGSSTGPTVPCTESAQARQCCCARAPGRTTAPTPPRVGGICCSRMCTRPRPGS